jgi:hypothetical protein
MPFVRSNEGANLQPGSGKDLRRQQLAARRTRPQESTRARTRSADWRHLKRNCPLRRGDRIIYLRDPCGMSASGRVTAGISTPISCFLRTQECTWLLPGHWGRGMNYFGRRPDRYPIVIDLAVNSSLAQHGL